MFLEIIQLDFTLKMIKII